MSRYDGPYGCCDTMAVLGPIERLAGHHPLCPRFGLAAIDARHGRGLSETATRSVDAMAAHDDRAHLLAVAKELQAEVARLRPVVEEVAESSLTSREPGDCASCGQQVWSEGHGGGCLVSRARAAGTLASIPPDECDGGDR